MRIVLCYPVQPRHLEQIHAAWPEADIVDAGQERIAAELPTADIFCGHAKTPVPWAQVAAEGRLQWIQSSAAGLDHCLVSEVVDSDITVTSASGVLAKQVADHTMALLTGVLRSFPAFAVAQQRREYVRQPTRDLFGATVGIVGLGGNGKLLARVLKTFDVTVLATDWFVENKTADVDEILPAADIDGLLPRIDALILAAPLTDNTRGMIDGRRLRLMRDDAVLVNVARGALVVERDLADVLNSGHLWGAGIDVAAEEPLPAASPLWRARNLIITPHVGGQRASRIDDMTELFCENLRRYRAGEPLINWVDKQLGFPSPHGGH